MDKCRKKKEHSVSPRRIWAICPTRNHCSYHRRYVPFLHEGYRTRQFLLWKIHSCQSDTTVCVFLLPKDPAHRPSVSSLNCQVGMLYLPLLNKNRVQFELNAIDFLSLPASKSKDVIVERTAKWFARI